MFEYDVVEVPADPRMMADKLNQFGEDGWEVCALYEHTILSTRMYAVVKRPKPTKTPETTGKCMCHVGLPGYICEYCRSLGHGSPSEKR